MTIGSEVGDSIMAMNSSSIASLCCTEKRLTKRESINRFTLQDFNQKQQTVTKLRFLKQELCEEATRNRNSLKWEPYAVCYRDKENTEHQLKCPQSPLFLKSADFSGKYVILNLKWA